MAKFIELHRMVKDWEGNRGAAPELVNLYNVVRIQDIGKACLVQTVGETFRPVESYEQVRRLIGACCGGIPIAELDSKIAEMD